MRNLFKLNRLSIFLVVVLLVSIYSVEGHHRQNRIFQDDSLIFDTVDDNSDFSTCDTYQIIFNSRIIPTTTLSINLFTPSIFTHKLFTRAPPV